jgi:hypothetical protein
MKSFIYATTLNDFEVMVVYVFASTFERAQNEKDSYRFELVSMCYKGSGMGIWQA